MGVVFNDSFVEWAAYKFPKFEEIINDVMLELDIKKTVKFQTNSNCPNSRCINCDSELFIIEFNDQMKISSLFEFAFIIAHELRHAYQTISGISSIHITNIGMNTTIRGWNGKLVYVMLYKNEDYFNMPWEIDANEFAMKYVEKKNIKKNITDRFYGKIISEIYDAMEFGVKDNSISFKLNDFSWIRSESLETIKSTFSDEGYSI